MPPCTVPIGLANDGLGVGHEGGVADAELGGAHAQQLGDADRRSVGEPLRSWRSPAGSMASSTAVMTPVRARRAALTTRLSTSGISKPYTPGSSTHRWAPALANIDRAGRLSIWVKPVRRIDPFLGRVAGEPAQQPRRRCLGAGRRRPPRRRTRPICGSRRSRIASAIATSCPASSKASRVRWRSSTAVSASAMPGSRRGTGLKNRRRNDSGDRAVDRGQHGVGVGGLHRPDGQALAVREAAWSVRS